jgi:hypothetical protein
VFTTLQSSGSGSGSSQTVTAQIITPSGLVYDIQSTNGGATFTVTAIQVPVSYKSSSGATVDTVTSVTSGGLIGATVTGISSSTTNGTMVTPTFTVNNTVVSSSMLGTDISTATTTAIQTVSTQQNGATTTSDVGTNVTSGNFSSNAP